MSLCAPWYGEKKKSSRRVGSRHTPGLTVRGKTGAGNKAREELVTVPGFVRPDHCAAELGGKKQDSSGAFRGGTGPERIEDGQW